MLGKTASRLAIDPGLGQFVACGLVGHPDKSLRKGAMPQQFRDGPQRRIDVLDYLRFGAACMVVGYHYLVYGPAKGHIDVSIAGPIGVVARYGYLGVDLFFLISGFVIMNSARNSRASNFAVSRATRLYPAFWPSMLLTALAIALWGANIGLSVSPLQVLANATMAPGLVGMPGVDGVYWSLLYELEFYLLVFLVLLARQGHRLGGLMPLWAVAMLACTLAAPTMANKLPFAGGLYAYFAVGAILAEVRHDSRYTSIRLLGLSSGTIVIALGSQERAKVVSDIINMEISPRVVTTVVLLWVTLIAAMLFPAVSKARLPGSRMLGALTYPVYLLHAVLGYILMSFVITDGNRWLVYPGVFLIILALAAAMNRVERMPVWKHIFSSAVGRPVALIESEPRSSGLTIPESFK